MRIETSVNEIVWLCSYRYYVVADRQTHTQTDYYNPWSAYALLLIINEFNGIDIPPTLVGLGDMGVWVGITPGVWLGIRPAPIRWDSLSPALGQGYCRAIITKNNQEQWIK